MNKHSKIKPGEESDLVHQALEAIEHGARGNMEVATSLGVTEHRIRQLVAKGLLEVPRKKAGRPRQGDAAMLAEVKRQWDAGLSVADIAVAVEQNYSNVYRWLQEIGVTVERRAVITGDASRFGDVRKAGAAGGRASAETLVDHICAREGCTNVVERGRTGSGRMERRRYCSKECTSIGRRDPTRRIVRPCAQCGEEVERWAIQVGEQSFCDNTCQSRYGIGRVQVEGRKFDSMSEVTFMKWCQVNKIPVERFDRQYDVEFDGHRYAPDFWLPTLKIAVEVKGFERPGDQAKWAAFRAFGSGQLAVVFDEDLFGLTIEKLVGTITA